MSHLKLIYNRIQKSQTKYKNLKHSKISDDDLNTHYFRKQGAKGPEHYIIVNKSNLNTPLFTVQGAEGPEHYI